MYVYELSSGLAVALSEMVLDCLMMVLAELLVSTDFGVCLLVELACCLLNCGILLDCMGIVFAMYKFVDAFKGLALLIQ